MGFFTYRQTKKVRQEVAGLRQDQRNTATAEFVGNRYKAMIAAIDKLPPEGKREIKAVRDRHFAKSKLRQSWDEAPGVGGIGLSKFEKQQWKVIKKYAKPTNADPLAHMFEGLEDEANDA